MSGYGDLACPYCDKHRKSKQSKTCGATSCSTKQREQTMLLRHGVRNPSQSDKIKQQKKETTLKNYGVENPSQSNLVKNKKIQTCLDRYGIEHTTQLETKKNKTKLTNLKKYGVEYSLQSKDVQRKSKQTKLKKYGSDTFNNRKKAKETCLEKYDCEHPMSDGTIFREKAKFTSVERYGVEHYTNREKYANTIIEKYGVENPMQVPEIAQKCLEHAYNSKEYKLPSGKVIRIQGYENKALDILLTKYSEDEIETEAKYMPYITYTGIDNKPHIYYPDIYLKSVNKIVEVKSTYTYRADLAVNLLKEKATREAGYEFEFMIF